LVQPVPKYRTVNWSQRLLHDIVSSVHRQQTPDGAGREAWEGLQG